MTEAARATGLVSVVIPTRERRVLLTRAIRSVLEQTHENLEVIVVDEASTDGTVEAVEGFRDPRVRLIRHDAPRGVAKARNAGLRVAQGRWTAFLDDDDLWAPTKLERQVAAMASQPGARWACVAAVSIDERQRIMGWHRLVDASDLRASLISVNDIPGSASSVLVETELLRGLGGFREDLDYSEDWECWIRLAGEARLAVVDEPLVAVRVVRGSRSHTVGGEKAANDRIRALHRGVAEVTSVSPAPEREARYLARQELRAGHRLTAARRLLATGRPRLIPLAVAVLILPPGWEPLWTRMREPQVVPRDWRRAVCAWLPPQIGRPAGSRNRITDLPRKLKEA